MQGLLLCNLIVALLLVLNYAGVDSFVTTSTISTKKRFIATTTTTRRQLGVDPSQWQDFLMHHAAHSPLDALQQQASSLWVAAADAGSDSVVNAAGDALAGAASAANNAVVGAAATAVDPAVTDAATTTDNGWFGFLTGPTEGLLQFIHTVLVTVGLNANAWGVSIIVLTLLIKAVTYPLTKTQLESTTRMQAMQPVIRDIQAKYQSNPEVMNQKMAEFYQENNINPLAGCLPSLAQIPIFIGLYRAVLELAKEDKLDEPFLWLPNLEGPTYGADPAQANDWLFKWVDGAPPLGWDDTIAFMILPVLLVVSQFASMQLMQPPKTDDQADQPTNNIVLKILPFLIGWFALNVPAALSVYWFTNNVVTTATSVFIRNSLQLEPASGPSTADAGTTTTATVSEIFAPPREKPAGFGSTGPVTSDVKPITSTAVDAEFTKTKTKATQDEEEEDEEEDDEDENETSASSSPKKKRGKKKRRRKN